MKLVGLLHFLVSISLMSTLHMDRAVVAVRVRAVRPTTSPSAHAHGLDHH
jgi:hypothetical protein